MTTKTITIHVDDEPVEIGIRTARKIDSLRRDELVRAGVQEKGSTGRQLCAFTLYPACVAAVVWPESVKNMSLDDFLERVDDPDVEKWIETVYELNPHWVTQLKTTVEYASQMTIAKE